VGFALSPNRIFPAPARIRLIFALIAAAVLLHIGARTTCAQTPDAPPAAEPPSANQPTQDSSPNAGPIAFVPLDPNSDSAAKVTGALEVSNGKAVIAKSGSITSGNKTTQVILPHRGVLRVCASTAVNLSSDATVPAGETPGLMVALDHGAVETSFATGQNSDVLLTPDFRILIGGPGSSELKVRLGQHGDTCVDNPGANAPYVVVSSVFEGGAYRVQPGQRVMFQHGSLKEVVDQEKEPCGCPAEARPGSNDFPLAQSAGLAPLDKPAPSPQPAQPVPPNPPASQPPLNEPLVYTAPAAPPQTMPEKPAAVPLPQPPTVQAQSPAPPAQQQKKTGFFHSIGRFFRKVFGAE
jgi:hypothetical protein